MNKIPPIHQGTYSEKIFAYARADAALMTSVRDKREGLTSHEEQRMVTTSAKISLQPYEGLHEPARRHVL